MAKKAKLPQTDYSIGGRDISNTAIPAYQANIGRMENYLNDPQGQIDSYLNKYYDNTTAQSDFLRNMQRVMANTTANNYAATGGGYSSAGQQFYDDAQRYYNDLGSRLYDAGVQSSASMANQYFNNLLNANSSYDEAYKNGQTYHNTELYNAQVDQANKNQLGSTLGKAGQGLGSILMTNPVTFGIGAGLTALGTAANSIYDTNVDSSILGAGASQNRGVGASGGAYYNPWNTTFNNILGGMRNYVNNTPTEKIPAWMRTWATTLNNQESK
jgi:hypothetical protein